MLLLPSGWGHATINLAPSIGFATELHFDRTIELLPANNLATRTTHVSTNGPPSPLLHRATKDKPSSASRVEDQGAGELEVEQGGKQDAVCSHEV